MSYLIEVVTLKPQPVLVVEETVAPGQFGEALARIFPQVHAYAEKAGADVTGMPFMRYLEMGERCRIQAGVPVAEAVDGAEPVLAGELPGGRALTTVHQGPYDGVGAAWDAVNAWRAEHGIEQSCGGWDIYENDPDEAGDPSELRTRLYQPIP